VGLTLTTGEIAAHFREVYGAKISKDTVSRITEMIPSDPQHIPVRITYRDEMSRDLRPVYTAPSEAVARERFAEARRRW
jgi:transposase-like protein